jgi:hypothetical protein
MFDLFHNTNTIKTSKHGIIKKKEKKIIIIFKVPTTSAKFSLKPQSNFFTLEAQVIKGFPCVMSCKELFEEGSILIQKNLVKLSLNIPPKLVKGGTLNFQIYPQAGKPGRTELHIHTFRISNKEEIGKDEITTESVDRENTIDANVNIIEKIIDDNKGESDLDIEAMRELVELEEFQNLQEAEKILQEAEKRKILEKLEQIRQMEELIEKEETDQMATLAELVKLANLNSENEVVDKKNEVVSEKESSKLLEGDEENIKKVETEEVGPELSARVRIERLGIKDILKRLKKSEKNIAL